MSRLSLVLMLCVASASCVELENICSSDTFVYKDTQVNAFYKVRQNITFQPLNFFLIDPTVTCDQSEFENKTNFFEALKIKNQYNRKFAEHFTEDLNGASVDELEEKTLEFESAWLPLYHMKKEERWAKCLQVFEAKTSRAINAFTTFERLSRYNSYPIHDGLNDLFHPDFIFKPETLQLIKILEKLFRELSTSAGGQTFALKSDEPWSIYFKMGGFVFPGEFKFLTEGRVQPDTKSLLTYDQYLPFYNADHSDKNCIPAKDLPLFYKNKGQFI